MPHRVSPSFQARRALLRHLAPRYQQASPAQKTLLLDSVVEWTGYTRKYAIELLNHGKHDQQTIQRRRLPQYRPAVQQALFLAWKATHYVCTKQLLPFLPSLVALLEGQGHLRLTEEERHQLLAMSVSTAERFLRTQRKPRLHGLSTTTPGPWCKSQIPVRLFSQWEENHPGFVEMDLKESLSNQTIGNLRESPLTNHFQKGDQSMKAVIYKDTKTVEVQERAMPLCGPDDVIVRNVRGGICGTDITGYLYGGRTVGFLPDSEFGHEMGVCL
jgi:hypothetical protein